MITYIGTNLSTPDDCVREYNIKSMIEKGNFGTVYDDCDKGGNCKYALKVIELPTDFGNDFDTEVEITKKASELGIGPGYINSWKRDGTSKSHDYIIMGFILTEKYDGTLKSIGYESIPLDIYKYVNSIISVWHAHGYIHGDLHGDNIVYKMTLQGAMVKLINFGLSFNVSNQSKNIKDRHSFSVNNLITVPDDNISEYIKVIDTMWYIG